MAQSDAARPVPPQGPAGTPGSAGSLLQTVLPRACPLAARCCLPAKLQPLPWQSRAWGSSCGCWSAGPEQPSGLTRPISGDTRVPLVAVLLSCWETLPVRAGRLEAALSVGPPELLEVLVVLGRAEKRARQLPAFGMHVRKRSQKLP